MIEKLLQQLQLRKDHTLSSLGCQIKSSDNRNKYVALQSKDLSKAENSCEQWKNKK